MSELVMKLKAQEKLIKSNVFKWQNIEYFSIVEFPYMVGIFWKRKVYNFISQLNRLIINELKGEQKSCLHKQVVCLFLS